MKTPEQLTARKTELKAALKRNKQRYTESLRRGDMEGLDAIYCENGGLRGMIELIDWVLDENNPKTC
jgi:hypothetical protein